MEDLASKLRIRNSLVREGLAEFLGTTLLLAFGDACVAQTVLTRGGFGSFVTIHLGWAAAVAIGVYACGGVSGGHLNPAVTVAMATIGRFPWVKVPVYFLAQYLGAFVGSFIVYITYIDSIHSFQNGSLTRDTAGIFTTFPKAEIGIGNAFADLFVGTAVLLLFVMAISDARNMEVPKFAVPALVGLVLMGIGMSFGANCGYAVNPARDFSPRLFTFIFGWGSGVFQPLDGHYWWIPIIAPHLGGIFGVWAYLLLIEFHWPSTPSPSENPSETIIIKTESNVKF